MKRLTPLLFLSLLPLWLGMFAFAPMPEKPDFAKTADFYQERTDTGRVFPVYLKKEQLGAALQAGEFKTGHPGQVYTEKDYPRDPDLPRYSGVITLDDGTLFLWSIPREGVIQLTDSQYRMGYVFYPKDMLTLKRPDTGGPIAAP